MRCPCAATVYFVGKSGQDGAEDDVDGSGEFMTTHEVAHLAEGLTLDHDGELIAAIYEAERALRGAARALRRAARVA